MIELTLSNRADIDSKTFYEDYGITGVCCKTCHCPYGQMYHCMCGNVACDACIGWSETESRVLNFNKNKKTKKKQRYILERIFFNSYNCNKCKRVVGLRL